MVVIELRKTPDLHGKPGRLMVNAMANLKVRLLFNGGLSNGIWVAPPENIGDARTITSLSAETTNL